MSTPEGKPCEHCGEKFTPKTTWQRFCKTQCRYDWHNREAERIISTLRKELRDLRGDKEREGNG